MMCVYIYYMSILCAYIVCIYIHICACSACMMCMYLSTFTNSATTLLCKYSCLLVRTRRVLFLNINPYLWGALFGTDFYRGTGQLMFWNVVWEITLNKLPSGTFFKRYLLFSFPDDCINRKTCSSFGRHLP